MIGNMQTVLHKSIDGTLYRHDYKSGRKNSPDPKQGVPLRLRQSALERITATGQTKQEFIEDAVYEKLNRQLS